MTVDKLKLLNLNCKNVNGPDYSFDLLKKKCIKNNNLNKKVSEKRKIVSTKKPKISEIKNEQTQDTDTTIKKELDESKEIIKGGGQCTSFSDCNYSGSCKDGVCVCDENYGGNNCTINLCSDISCGNGICSDGICKCNPGFEYDDNNSCNNNKCRNNKCGQNDEAPRGRCVVSSDPNEDGTCICNTGWIGDKCDRNLCKNVVVDSQTKKISYVDKCKNNSFCDIQTGKCICNVLYNDDLKTPIMDENGDYSKNSDLYWTGNKCDLNRCISDGKYKCNNGSCDLETGQCSCDKEVGYSIDDNCKNNLCPGGKDGCGEGICVGPINNDRNQFECKCNEGWFKDASGICSKNDCIEKDSSNNYVKDGQTGLYKQRCNPKVSKCVLDENNNFKKCECNEYHDRSKPDLETCDICKSYYTNYPDCNYIQCDNDEVNSYVDSVSEECRVNKCVEPSGCKIGYSAISVGDKRFRCKTNNSFQCRNDGCKEGYHYKSKVCLNKFDEEIDCSNDMLKEELTNNSLVENFSSLEVGACFTGIGGVCEDNVDKNNCLGKEENTRTYATRGMNQESIVVSDNFRNSLVFNKNKTCGDFKNKYDKCTSWIENPQKTQVSNDCLKQIWKSFGCNDLNNYADSWNKEKTFEQNFLDYVYWRSNNCGRHGIKEVTQIPTIKPKNDIKFKPINENENKIILSSNPSSDISVSVKPNENKKIIISVKPSSDNINDNLINISDEVNDNKIDITLKPIDQEENNKKNKISKILHGQCKINQCSCANGIGASGSDCQNNGDEKCSICNYGYYKKKKQKDSDEFECVKCTESGDIISGDKCLNCSVDGCFNKGICNEFNKCDCSGNYGGNLCMGCKGDYIGTHCEIDRCNSDHTNTLNCSTSCSTDSEGFSKCLCTCGGNSTCGEDGSCSCTGLWSGANCDIGECTNDFCKNEGVCSNDENGKASCNCEGTGFIGMYCDKQFESGNLTNCLDTNFNFSGIGDCNSLTSDLLKESCLSKNSYFYEDSKVKKCLPKLKKPILTLKKLDKKNNLFEIKFNKTTVSDYIPPFDDLVMLFKLTNVTNDLVHEDVVLINQPTNEPSKDNPIITFKNNDCDVFNRYCYVLDLQNLKSNTDYKIKIKYRVPKYRYDNKDYESEYSEEIEFKSKCLLTNEKCKKKCKDDDENLIDCGPTENDPFVPENRREKKEGGISWPYFTQLDGDNCECTQLDDESKRFLCQKINNNNQNENFIYMNGKCHRKLRLKDCLDDREGLHVVYDQFFEKLPNPSSIPPFTNCSLPEKSKLVSDCNSKGGLYKNNLCYPPLKEPIIYDSLVDTNFIKYKFKVRYELDDHKIVYKLNSNDEVEVNPQVIDGVERLPDNECDCGITDIIMYKENTNDCYFCYSIKISNLTYNTNYNFKLKIKSYSIENYESNYSNSIRSKTTCGIMNIFDTCKSTFGPDPSSVGDASVSEDRKDTDLDDRATWPFFKINNVDNCFCREMTNIEKRDFCEGNVENSAEVDLNKKKFPGFPNHIYHKRSCLKLKTQEECELETPDTEDPLFKYELDTSPEWRGTRCKALDDSRKQEICNNVDGRKWIDSKCRYTIPSINIDNITLIEVTKNSVELKVTFPTVNDVNVNEITLRYNLHLNETLVSQNIPIISKSQNIKLADNYGISDVTFVLESLSPNSNYDIELKINTNISNLESEYSDKYSFTTPCSQLSENFCKGTYGVQNNNPNVTNKKPGINKWPYHKRLSDDKCSCVPYDDQLREKECRELLKSDEEEKLCKKIYDSYDGPKWWLVNTWGNLPKGCSAIFPPKTNGTGLSNVKHFYYNKRKTGREIECGTGSDGKYECINIDDEIIDIETLNSESGQCQKKIQPVGPSKNITISSLEVTDEVNNSGIVSDLGNKITENIYRLLLKWSIPDTDDENIFIGTSRPDKYKIMRSTNQIDYEIAHTYNVKNVMNDSSFFWIDNTLNAGTTYYYKINPENSGGVYEDSNNYSGTTIQEKKSNNECNNLFENVPDTSADDYRDLKYKSGINKGKSFQGFYKRLNSEGNACISLSNTQKTNICQTLENIHSNVGIPNYFDPSAGKCKAFAGTITKPGPPELTITKIKDGFKLKFIAPTNLGNPQFTHYSLSFRKRLDNSETESWSEWSVISSPDPTTDFFIRDDNIVYNHTDLDPGRQYQYELKSVSIDNVLWKDKQGGELIGSSYGALSEAFRKKVTTDYAKPKWSKSISLLKKSYSTCRFSVLNNVPNDLDAIEKGGFGINLNKTKIIRKTVGSTEDDVIFEYRDPFNNQDFPQNKLSSNKPNIKLDYSTSQNQEYIILTDNTVLPDTSYKYLVLSINDQNLETDDEFVNSFSVTTDEKDYIYLSEEKLELKPYSMQQKECKIYADTTPGKSWHSENTWAEGVKPSGCIVYPNDGRVFFNKKNSHKKCNTGGHKCLKSKEIENFTNISNDNESINYLDDINIVEADSGMPDGSLTQEECFKEAEKMGISDASVWSWNGWPNGCIKTGENQVRYNKAYGGKPCGVLTDNGQVNCIQKKGKLNKYGNPDYSLSQEECNNYAKLNNSSLWVTVDGHENNNPSGCQLWSGRDVRYNPKFNNHACTHISRGWLSGCIQKEKYKVFESSHGMPDFSLSEDECKRYAEGLTDKFEYYKKGKNTSCNPGDKIKTLDECKNAVKSLKLTLTQDWVNGSNNASNLGGCFVEQGVIRFNKHSGVKKHVNMSPICKRSRWGGVLENDYEQIKYGGSQNVESTLGGGYGTVTRDGRVGAGWGDVKIPNNSFQNFQDKLTECSDNKDCKGIASAGNPWSLSIKRSDLFKPCHIGETCDPRMTFFKRTDNTVSGCFVGEDDKIYYNKRSTSIPCGAINGNKKERCVNKFNIKNYKETTTGSSNFNIGKDECKLYANNAIQEGPGWGYNETYNHAFKKKFYCSWGSDNVNEYDFSLIKKSYLGAENYCKDKGMALASRKEILDKNYKFNGLDVWTPIRDNNNTWLQIGNKHHEYGIMSGKTLWGGEVDLPNENKGCYLSKSNNKVYYNTNQSATGKCNLNLRKCIKRNNFYYERPGSNKCDHPSDIVPEENCLESAEFIHRNNKNHNCVGSTSKNEPYYHNNLNNPGCCDGLEPFTHEGVKYCRRLVPHSTSFNQQGEHAQAGCFVDGNTLYHFDNKYKGSNYEKQGTYGGRKYLCKVSPKNDEESKEITNFNISNFGITKTGINNLSVSENECKLFAISKDGYSWSGNVDISGENKGCYIDTSNKKVYFNKDVNATGNCSLSGRSCVQKVDGNTIEVKNGKKPDLSLSQQECEVYANSKGGTFEVYSSSWAPSGCIKRWTGTYKFNTHNDYSAKKIGSKFYGNCGYQTRTTKWSCIEKNFIEVADEYPDPFLIKQSLSSSSKNKIKLKTRFNKHIDPNIRWFNDSNIYPIIDTVRGYNYETSYKVKYKLKDASAQSFIYKSYVSDTDLVDIEIGDDFEANMTYVISIRAEHHGYLKKNELSDGVVSVQCNSPWKSIEYKTRDIVEEDCISNDYFKQEYSIKKTDTVYESEVYYKYDTQSKKCIPRTEPNNGLDEWCKEKYGNDYTFVGSSVNKCKLVKDGFWTVTDEYSDQNKGSCTISGLDQGSEIVCNGGKRIVMKYVYTPPVNGGADVEDPSSKYSVYRNAKNKINLKLSDDKITQDNNITYVNGRFHKWTNDRIFINSRARSINPLFKFNNMNMIIGFEADINKSINPSMSIIGLVKDNKKDIKNLNHGSFILLRMYRSRFFISIINNGKNLLRNYRIPLNSKIRVIVDRSGSVLHQFNSSLNNGWITIKKVPNFFTIEDKVWLYYNQIYKDFGSFENLKYVYRYNYSVMKDGSNAYLLQDCSTQKCMEKCEIIDLDYWNNFSGSSKVNLSSPLNNASYRNYCLQQSVLETDYTVTHEGASTNADTCENMNKSGCGDPSSSQEKLIEVCTNGAFGADTSINCLTNPKYNENNVNIFTTGNVVETTITEPLKDDDGNLVIKNGSTIDINRKRYTKTSIINCTDTKSSKKNFTWCPWNESRIKDSCIHNPTNYNDQNKTFNKLGEACSEDGFGLVNKIILCSGSDNTTCNISEKPILDEVCYLSGGICGKECKYNGHDKDHAQSYDGGYWRGPYTKAFGDAKASDFTSKLKRERCSNGFRFRTRTRTQQGRKNRYPSSIIVPEIYRGKEIENGGGSVCDDNVDNKLVFLNSDGVTETVWKPIPDSANSIYKNCNNGVCVNKDSIAECECDDGFAGDVCQYSDSITCNDGGKANDDGTCSCYKGANYYKKDNNTSCNSGSRVTSLNKCKEAVNFLNLNSTLDNDWTWTNQALSDNGISQIYELYYDAHGKNFIVKKILKIWTFSLGTDNNIKHCRIYYSIVGKAGGNRSTLVDYRNRYFKYNTTTNKWSYHKNSTNPKGDLGILTADDDKIDDPSINGNNESYLLIYNNSNVDDGDGSYGECYIENNIVKFDIRTGVNVNISPICKKVVDDVFAGSNCQYSEKKSCTDRGFVDDNGNCNCDKDCQDVKHNFNIPYTPNPLSVNCFQWDANNLNWNCDAKKPVKNYCRRGCGECTPRYSGDKCQFSSLDQCNDNGTPNPDGSCTCKSGYAGNKCQYSDNTNCNGFGTVDNNGNCKCNTGYHNSGSTCARNICNCPHGVPATGTACDINGSTKCVSCPVNYGLSNNTCSLCSSNEYSPSGTGSCTRLSRCHTKNSSGSGQNFKGIDNTHYRQTSAAWFGVHVKDIRFDGTWGYHQSIGDSTGRSYEWQDRYDCANKCRSYSWCNSFLLESNKCKLYTGHESDWEQWGNGQRRDIYYQYFMNC